MSSDLAPDQKRYLEGFASGLNAARAAPREGAEGGTPKEKTGPDAIAAFAGAGPGHWLLVASSMIRKNSSENCIHLMATNG